MIKTHMILEIKNLQVSINENEILKDLKEIKSKFS